MAVREIIRLNYSDICRRRWDMARPGGPKLQRKLMDRCDPVSWFVETVQIFHRELSLSLNLRSMMYFVN